MQLPARVTNRGQLRLLMPKNPTMRTLRVARQQRHDVTTVQNSIRWCRDSRSLQARHKQVHHHRRLFTDIPRPDSPWPSGNHRHPITSLIRAPLHASQAACTSTKSRSVVTAEHHQRPVINAHLLQLRQHLSHTPIQLHHCITIQTRATLLVKRLRDRQRLVRHRLRKIQKERPLPVALNERRRPLSIAPGQRRLNHRILHHLRPLQNLHRPHVIRVGNAKILVKSPLSRQPTRLVPKMPFPNHPRRITRRLHPLRQRDLRLR